MNVVNKIVVELTMSRESQVAQISAQWTPQMIDILTEVLNEVCRPFENTTKVWTIDSLELNLGNLLENTLRSKLYEFKNKLRETLTRQIQEVMTRQESRGAPGFGFTNLGQFSPSAFSGIEPFSKQNSVHTYETIEKHYHALIHFFKTGNMPWWQEESGFDINNTIKMLLATQPHLFKAHIIELIYQKPFVAERLVEHSSIETLKEILADWGLEITAFEKVIAEKKLKPPMSKSKVFQKAELDKPLLVKVFKKLGEYIIEGKSIKTDIIIQEALTLRTGIPEVSEKQEAFIGLQHENTEGRVKYHVEHAGLILTAGFLAHYFKELGFLNASGFVSNTTQMQAVHALKYLATGKGSQTEYTLALEKLLCGIDPEDFVSVDLDLDEAALETQSQELLTTLIDYWAALKKTSIEGLRQTFLCRKGILEQLSDREWTVHVEKGMFDILLNMLPPALPFSTIVFSWSKFILYVNWERP